MSASAWGDGTPNEAFEIPPAEIIQEEAANYLILESDAQKVIDYIGAGGHTFTLPATVDVGAGFAVWIRNSGTGNVTISPQTGDTVDAAASLIIGLDQTVLLMVKGTDYGIIMARNTGVTAASVSVTPAGNIASTNVQAALEELDAEKAPVAGNAAQVFRVDTAVGADDAVPLSQVQSLVAAAGGGADTLDTAGTPPAFTLTPAETLGAYVAGLNYRVKFHATAASSSQTSGTLTIGRRYRIDEFITGDNFTNVGAPSNATGVSFIATGTTPAAWANASTLTKGSTLDISGLGAKNLTIYTSAGAKDIVAAVDAVANMLTDVEYDGTEFVVLDRLTPVVVPITYTGGSLIAYTKIIADDAAWTPNAATNRIVVRCVGGGGAGGGVPDTVTATAAGGDCGAEKWGETTVIAASYAITIGAGGTGVSAGNGNDGGATSFGTLVTAAGGEGANSAASAGYTRPLTSGRPKDGAGGVPGNASAGGNAAANTGAGGGGANGVSAFAYAGGDGGSGLVQVWEYA